MSNTTAIAWTDFSSNPVKYRDRETGKTVWACVKKSTGCTHCYSEALALRWNKGRAFARPNIDKVVPFLDEQEMKRLATDPKLAGRKVFIGDMTDIFGSWVEDDILDHLFAVFAWRQDVTFQCLTKRPLRMAAWFAERFQHHTIDGPRVGWHGREERVFERMQDSPYIDIDPFNDAHWKTDGTYRWPGWPLPNVWLGTSVEDQRAADERIPHLLNTPAAVRFLSCEPLLGPIEFSDVTKRSDAVQQLGHKAMSGIDWVIVGGESGPGHRAMDLAWLTSIVKQCLGVDVAVFTKQDSGQYPGKQGRIPDDVWNLKQFPLAASAPPPAGGDGAMSSGTWTVHFSVDPALRAYLAWLEEDTGRAFDLDAYDLFAAGYRADRDAAASAPPPTAAAGSEDGGPA
jgi:protein gp37